jgi:hypothetical protein
LFKLQYLKLLSTTPDKFEGRGETEKKRKKRRRKKEIASRENN